MLVNGPLWCYFYALRHLEKSNSRLGERFHGSQPDNNAVVYGTEECLTDALDYIRENRAPSILLIENSCSVSLIGDDIEGIAAKAKLPFSVIGMDSGGLSGGFAEGYSKASIRLWQYLDLPDISCTDISHRFPSRMPVHNRSQDNVPVLQAGYPPFRRSDVPLVL